MLLRVDIIRKLSNTTFLLPPWNPHPTMLLSSDVGKHHCSCISSFRTLGSKLHRPHPAGPLPKLKNVLSPSLDESTEAGIDPPSRGCRLMRLRAAREFFAPNITGRLLEGRVCLSREFSPRLINVRLLSCFREIHEGTLWT